MVCRLKSYSLAAARVLFIFIITSSGKSGLEEVCTPFAERVNNTKDYLSCIALYVVNEVNLL